jgi:hypothetical protein
MDQLGGHRLRRQARWWTGRAGLAPATGLVEDDGPGDGPGGGVGRGVGAGGAGEVGRQTLPAGDAVGDQQPEAEGKGSGPVVQDGMAKVLVAGVQPGGSSVLAGIRNRRCARLRFSSRAAR